MAKAPSHATHHEAPPVVEKTPVEEAVLPPATKPRSFTVTLPTGGTETVEADCIEDVVRDINSRLKGGRTFTAKSLTIVEGK